MKECIKKSAAILFSTILCFNGINFGKTNALDVSPLIVNNLVLFAQFDSTEGYNFMSDYTDDMIQMCNDSSSVLSLAGYIDKISYGQMKTECWFPQLEGDTIIPYTMSQSEESYLNKDMVVLEVLENVDIPSDVPLDGNNDGVVDNIILVMDASEEAMGDQFWPCAFSLGGADINGLYSGMVNIQNSKSLFKSLVSGGAGALSHEFLHSIGYPDLYHSTSGTGTPVGQWDIMASNSIYLQYPLAYLRASVSGWLDTQDITESGTYTLQPASSDSGNRVYLLKTPLSDTEFFAVEFRQKGSLYGNQMDRKIYGTGMVIYRVNTEVDGNHKTDKDEIYVFRPGETELNACQGDIFSSYYGGEGMADSIGSLDFSDGIADGALVYSDGTNSGIRISNITVGEESLTFDAEFAEFECESYWQSAGDTSSIDARMSLDMNLSESRVLRLLSSDGNSAVTSIISDGTISSAENVMSGGSVNNAKLVTVGEDVYILYNDRDYNYVLCKYDTESGEWITKLESSEMSQYTDIAADNGKLYITYTVGVFPYELHALCYDPETEKTESMGGIIAGNACNISLTADNGIIAAAYRNFGSGSKPQTAVWNGTDWDIYTLSDKSCGTAEITSADGILVAAVTGDAAGLYIISSGETSFYAFPETDGSCFAALPLVYNGKIYTAINTQQTDDFSLYELNGSDWVKIGNSIASEVVNNPAIAACGNRIYAAYSTSNGTTAVKCISLEDEVLLGDINLDGNVNSSDMVMLQGYLIGRISLNQTQLERADINEDESADVFDMVFIRKILQ